MIRALIFDFDGLIIDTETPLIDVWEDMHQRAGLAYQRSTAIGLIGHVETDFDPWAGFGPTSDRAALEAEHQRLYRARVVQLPVLPGVLDCLREAKTRGLLLGVASSSSHRHVDGHLGRLGLLPYFDVIRCRDDVKATKPAPDLYLAAIRELNVAPQEAIAFEDSHPGTTAAKRAGLRCVAIPNASTRHHDFSAADLRLGSLAERPLAELLRHFSDPAQDNMSTNS